MLMLVPPSSMFATHLLNHCLRNTIEVTQCLKFSDLTIDLFIHLLIDLFIYLYSVFKFDLYVVFNFRITDLKRLKLNK